MCGLTCPHVPHLAAKPRGTIKLFGRGGSALASLGLARYKSRAPLTRRLPPCRPHTHKYGRGAIGFSFAPLPQLSHAPDFFISCGACRSGHAGGVPLPREPIGSGGTPCRPHTGRGGTPCRPHYLATAYTGRLGEASLPCGVPTTRPPYLATAHYLSTHRIANGHSSASLQSHLRTGFFAT